MTPISLPKGCKVRKITHRMEWSTLIRNHLECDIYSSKNWKDVNFVNAHVGPVHPEPRTQNPAAKTSYCLQPCKKINRNLSYQYPQATIVILQDISLP